MKKMKLTAFAALMSLTMIFAVVTKGTSESKLPKAYVGIGYAMAKNGASAGKGAIVGVVGVAHAAWEGFIWGAMFGGGVGAIAGAVVGL